MSVVYLKSAFGSVSPVIQKAADNGLVTIVEQADFDAQILSQHQGLITGQQCDQNVLLQLKPALEAFMNKGSRWFFNGHIVRPFLDGLHQYQPISAPKRADFDLNSLNFHPIFAEIDLKKLETNKNVAGFYGRGCNPLPENAVAINGLGAKFVPVDWVWHRTKGGRFFSHSGNDLSSMGLEWGLAPLLSERILEWVAGGACLDESTTHFQQPQADLPLAKAQSYQGARINKATNAPRIVVPSSGNYYHIHSLEGEAYSHAFDVITTPEELGIILIPTDILWVPCRTPAQRMIAQKPVIAKHLENGGTVIALGESRSDLWLDHITFHETPTNWWWWLDEKADLGVRVTDPKHPLMKDMTTQDVTWHLHGWFEPPAGAQILARNGDNRPILYVDDVSTNGRMIISSLDPMFHHGSHFMPATTRFLDRFIPNLKAMIHA